MQVNLEFDVKGNMASVNEKRFSNVDDSTDYSDEDSDFVSQNKLSIKKVMESKDKRSYSSKVTKQLRRNCAYVQEARHGKSFNNYDRVKKQKCFSKNALMARENRLKKKLYLQNLEDTVDKYRDENKKLSSILDNQCTVIEDLRKEVKYLKNVLANSTDIGRLLKSINQNIGMSVSTSSNNQEKSDNTTSIMDSTNETFHPWAEFKSSQQEEFDCNSIHGECPVFPLSDFEQESNWNDLFSELHSSMPVDFEEMNWEVPNQLKFPSTAEESEEHMEHNYTNKLALDNIFEDAGVCLHIAKHKVSLELCSSCSEKASTSWNEN